VTGAVDRRGTAWVALGARAAEPGVLTRRRVAEGEGHADIVVAARAIACVVAKGRLMAGSAVGIGAWVGESPGLAGLLVTVGARARSVIRRRLVAFRAILARLMRVHPGLARLVVTSDAGRVAGVPGWPGVAKRAVHAAVGVDERPCRPRLVTDLAVTHGRVFRGVAPRTTGLGQIVARRALDVDVAGNVG
jgi:hypothetical protein